MISFKERIYVAMRRFLLRNRKKGKKKGKKKESSSKYVLFLKQARLACFANFSGRTVDHPDLLKYSCQVECRVRPVKPARIWSARTTEPQQEKSDGEVSSSGSSVAADLDARSHSISVLLSRPIFALEFSSLRMHVDAPRTVVPHRDDKKVGYSSST